MHAGARHSCYISLARGHLPLPARGRRGRASRGESYASPGRASAGDRGRERVGETSCVPRRGRGAGVIYGRL